MYIILRTDYYIYINGTIISLFLPNKYCSYIDVNFNCKIPSINDDLHTTDPRFVLSLQIRVLSLLQNNPCSKDKINLVTVFVHGHKELSP